jgi:hypothetical protein
MQAMQQVTYAAKSLAGLVAGWALGHGLMWGALFLGGLLDMAASDAADRALLGGMLLAIGLLAVLLVSASLAELRRVPTWLMNFLLGMATAPALTLFSWMAFVWGGWTD